MIESRQNALIKRIRALKDKKNRDAEGLYIAESIKMVKEAVSCVPDDVLYVVGTLARLNDVGIDQDKKIEVSQSVFESISTEVSPEGVLAVIRKPKANINPPTGKCLLLDRVMDPANVGAIIRTAVSAGYKDVYCFNTADPYSAKAVRASMSGVYKANVYTGSLDDLLSAINMPLIVADMLGENVYSFKLDTDFCLVIGNEANGVSDLLKEKAKYSVSIPMQNGMESLNAGVSAGILMYLLNSK